jgi:hypothetical protein
MQHEPDLDLDQRGFPADFDAYYHYNRFIKRSESQQEFLLALDRWNHVRVDTAIYEATEAQQLAGPLGATGSARFHRAHCLWRI